MIGAFSRNEVSRARDIPILEVKWNLPTNGQTLPNSPSSKQRQANGKRYKEQTDSNWNQLGCIWAQHRHAIHGDQVEKVERGEEKRGTEAPENSS